MKHAIRFLVLLSFWSSAVIASPTVYTFDIDWYYISGDSSIDGYAEALAKKNDAALYRYEILIDLDVDGYWVDNGVTIPAYPNATWADYFYAGLVSGDDVDGSFAPYGDFNFGWDSDNGTGFNVGSQLNISWAGHLSDMLVGTTNISATDFFGQDGIQGGAGNIQGNATLVGISAVPLPAAGWLFASAIASVAGFGNFRKKLAR